ncbi:WxL domain-containing protein [Bacillus thuringiensis]|uniref:WxL domain-containing protein n=1 Tax=Bacillus thuringiensis TaxID=1428 RepID=UPI002FBEE358
MKLTKVALAGVVSFSTVLAAGAPAFAEEAATMKSITDVSFTESKEVTKPVNPLDPTTEVETKDPNDPNDPHEPGTKGPLSIDYVSNFHFGEQVMSGNDQVYTAKLDTVKAVGASESTEVPNYVQVTDNRGTNKGWKLTVKQNGQFKAGESELTGAALNLSNPVANSTISKEHAPEVKPVALNPNGDTQDVAIANTGKGMGTWVTTYGKDAKEGTESITLAVPGSTSKVKDAKYQTSLTWTLEDTPQ